jgi:hypothetical protein
MFVGLNNIGDAAHGVISRPSGSTNESSGIAGGSVEGLHAWTGDVAERINNKWRDFMG